MFLASPGGLTISCSVSMGAGRIGLSVEHAAKVFRAYFRIGGFCYDLFPVNVETMYRYGPDRTF